MLPEYKKDFDLSDEVIEKVKEYAVELFDEKSGANTTDLCTMEIAVLTAFKE